MNTQTLATTALLAALIATDACGQLNVLVTDRARNTIWHLSDANSNGIIDEPDEVHLFFSAANTMGTPPPVNPNTIGASPTGLVVVGDQDSSARHLVWLFDRNCDGDAEDDNESGILAGPTNESGISFAFPTGVAFDSAGRLFITNAGNGFGNDGIYELRDANGDLDAQDAGEATEYVTIGAFGAGNGPYSPQEIVFDASIGFLRNSSPNLNGVYRFTDLNQNGRADDPGEFALHAGAGNADGLVIGSGFAIDRDPTRSNSLYTLSLATGGVDQLYRVHDANADGDAQDSQEITLVWSSAESGFSSIDAVAISDGAVLISDNSGIRIIRLRDLDGDGLFTGPGERDNFYANSSAMLGAARAMAVYHPPVCCDPDVNCDGVPDQGDVACAILAVAGDRSCYCQPDPDFNRDGVPDQGDVADVILTVAGAPCP